MRMHHAASSLSSTTKSIAGGRKASRKSAAFDAEAACHFSTAGEQTVLQVDGRQGRGKLPQVRSGRADQRAQLSETPKSGCNLLIASRHHQGKPSRIVPVRFHPKARLFNRPRLRAFRPARHRLMEVRKVQKASVIESRKPLRGYAANRCLRDTSTRKSLETG